MGRLYSLVLLAIPVFMVFSVFAARFTGDKKIESLTNELYQANITTSELQEINRRLNTRINELMKYEELAKEAPACK